MTASPDAFHTPPKPVLSHASVDPEARLGLPSGRFTTPSAFVSLMLGSALMGALYGLAWLLSSTGGGAIIWEYLTGFSGIPIPIAAISCWTIAILLLKMLKIAAQRTALRLRFMPEDPGFSLSQGTVDRVITAVESTVDDPTRFMLLDRVLTALKSIRNLGRPGDIGEVLNAAAEGDEAAMDSGYTLVGGFIWAVPVLGFLGTIIGLTEAIGRFGGVLASKDSDNLDALASRLTDVLGGLDTAFITTGEGLVAALCLYLFRTAVRRADEQLLDDVRLYCTRNVTARVRVESI
ncbi:MAG: MotA/TolQ/ExbB proton channel family protein [Phycisphaerales bacterium]|nr:MotA/TolQ/ExbB proton channel family protein [Phycisphaerales bacterium]